MQTVFWCVWEGDDVVDVVDSYSHTISRYRLRHRQRGKKEKRRKREEMWCAVFGFADGED